MCLLLIVISMLSVVCTHIMCKNRVWSFRGLRRLPPPLIRLPHRSQPPPRRSPPLPPALPLPYSPPSSSSSSSPFPLPPSSSPFSTSFSPPLLYHLYPLHPPVVQGGRGAQQSRVLEHKMISNLALDSLSKEYKLTRSSAKNREPSDSL